MLVLVLQKSFQKKVLQKSELQFIPLSLHFLQKLAPLSGFYLDYVPFDERFATFYHFTLFIECRKSDKKID
jgi:hypothetical protein